MDIFYKEHKDLIEAWLIMKNLILDSVDSENKQWDIYPYKQSNGRYAYEIAVEVLVDSAMSYSDELATLYLDNGIEVMVEEDNLGINAERYKRLLDYQLEVMNPDIIIGGRTIKFSLKNTEELIELLEYLSQISEYHT